LSACMRRQVGIVDSGVSVCVAVCVCHSKEHYSYLLGIVFPNSTSLNLAKPKSIISLCDSCTVELEFLGS
jgi:arginine/ornithine N-succinyltransferase beta subunit